MGNLVELMIDFLRKNVIFARFICLTINYKTTINEKHL